MKSRNGRRAPRGFAGLVLAALSLAGCADAGPSAIEGATPGADAGVSAPRDTLAGGTGAKTPDASDRNDPGSTAGADMGVNADTLAAVPPEADAGPFADLNGMSTPNTGEALSWTFRLGKLTIISPPLCYAAQSSADCFNVEAMINASFREALNDAQEPTDLILALEREAGAQEGELRIGLGACVRSQGELLDCSPSEALSAEFEHVAIDDPSRCAEIAAENPATTMMAGAGRCVATPKVTHAVAIFEGVTLKLLGAQVVGIVGDDAGRIDGTVQGFITVAAAEQVLLDITGPGITGSFSLADLLHAKARYESEDSGMGWNLVLGFSGKAAPGSLP